MRKIEKRTVICMALAILLAAGMAVFLIKYFAEGGKWASSAFNRHLYDSNGILISGRVLDRDGDVLSDVEGGKRTYYDNVTVRKATLHAVGDLYGKIVGKPLWQLIGGAANAATAGASASVPAGAAIGLGSAVETAAAARRCAEAGYKRVKLKVKPGTALACAQAVRAALPDMMITLDANQSFSEREAEELRGLDGLNVAWIEEPLDPRRLPPVGPTDLFSRLARLQRTLRTPICLDESIVRPEDLSRALAQPELRCYALKLGKCGGVQPALDFVQMARKRGIEVWMGGMYDTGVSRRLHAAFETLSAVGAPGDIGATARYFSCDITDPPYTAERGMVTLNREGHASGLGCDLNRSALENVLVERLVIA